MNKLQTVLDALEKAKRQVIHANVAPHGCINEAITVVHELMAHCLLYTSDAADE